MKIQNIIIGVLLLACILLILFRPHPTNTLTDVNQKYIDSIKVLKQQQLHYDSLIANYNAVVDTLNHKIDNLDTKQVINRIIYKDKIKLVNSYTPSELDSFFKQRYHE